MSCFLSCFGLSRRRRRPTSSAHKFLTADHNRPCYKPLEYDIDDTHKHIHNPDPRFSDEEDVNTSGLAVKKKVTFSSIVTTHEAIGDDDSTTQVLENGKEEIDKEEEKGSTTSQINTYPSGYRYQNLTENWDEEEEEEDMIYEESDELLDDDDDDDDDDDEDSDVEFNLSPAEADKIDEPKRSRKYLCPVLVPVENITQWRTMKAKHERSAKAKIESKENIESEIIDRNGHSETGKPGLVPNQN